MLYIKNKAMCKSFLFNLLFLMAAVSLSAQNYSNIVMHSNRKNIMLFDGETKQDWTITPSLNPDIFKCYNTTEKTRVFKFVSDIDSLEFIAEVNKPIYFSIIYKGDTAHTAIEFTDRIATTLSDNDKLYALSLFWSEAKYNFAFIDKLNFDLDSLYRTYIPKILATTNDYEFYEVMGLFAGSFHDGHTQVYYSEGSAYTDYVPMLARYFDDELRIIHVKENMAATFPVGSTIIEINGLKTEEYMKKYIEPYIDSDFKPTVQRLSASLLLSAKLVSDTLTIKYRMPDGKIRTNPLVRDGHSREGEPSTGHQSSYSSQPVEVSWKDDDIAVLAFNTFNDRNGELITLFDKLKDTLYSAKGIVIDLRNNRGGGTSVAWHLLQYLIKDDYFLNFAWQTRTNDGVKKAQGNFRKEYEDYYKNAAYRTVPADTIYIPDSIKRFDVPIVVLFSTMTVSAAEDFLIILYERPDRPLFIGQPSFGSTGSPLVVWGFPDNGFARVCARRVLFPYSMKPFTEGIQPDIPVNYTFDEFVSGKDKDMEVAVEELKKQILTLNF
jgi:C-terminal processing protease CtpA/Prc